MTKKYFLSKTRVTSFSYVLKWLVSWIVWIVKINKKIVILQMLPKVGKIGPMLTLHIVSSVAGLGNPGLQSLMFFSKNSKSRRTIHKVYLTDIIFTFKFSKKPFCKISKETLPYLLCSSRQCWHVPQCSLTFNPKWPKNNFGTQTLSKLTNYSKSNFCCTSFVCSKYVTSINEIKYIETAVRFNYMKYWVIFLQVTSKVPHNSVKFLPFHSFPSGLN